MSTTAPSDRYPTSATDRRGSNVNAGIDSSFTHDPAHRGSLAATELDSIHQTKSFKQAIQIQEEDNLELATKLKQLERAKELNK
ncbi:unnamed protein product [Adineta steineri]|uniref:Uncharacterized protein n=1 Tax=Adineta steineri TaxID=433720 RepID=A0A815QS90_9BILA|nr:unnamed protein product [Adineta steineri]CAF4146201.1 unnamed protein product [Adineta steineri]